MKKVITTMLVAAMVLSMAVPTSAATITRKKSTGTTASTTKVSGDYSLKMVDKTLQFIRGGKVVSSIETKDGKITLRKSSAGGISVVFTDANGKRRNITLGKQNSVALSGTFVQVSVDKALGSSFEVEMEKGSKVTNFYAKGAAKVTLNGSVTTLNVTSSNANVAANGTVSRAYAVNKKAITGMSSGKITQTSTGTSASGSVNTSTGSSSSSNTTVNSGSGSGSSSSSGGSSGIIINGGGSNGGTNTVAAPKITQQPASVEIEEGKTATLTIKATATGKISYQWYDVKTGKAIAGATSNTLTVSPKETTSYYCMVTNTVGSKKATIRSTTATVTIKGQVVVVEKPDFIKQPVSQTVEVGTETTLTVEVKAVTGLTPNYQWYTVDNNGTTPVNTEIPNAKSATLTVKPEEAGTVNYFCKVVNVNAKGVKSEAVDSDIVGITATAKVDDADLAKAKTAVEALMNKEYPDMTTLENAIKEAAGTTVKPEIKLTEGEDGKVTGTVTLTKDGVKDPVVIDFTATIKAEPTENADLKAAKDAIEALNANSYADATAAINAIKAAVTNEKIDVNTDDVKENADKTRIVGDVVLTITVDGKPVTATAKFDAAVTQQGEAETPVFKAPLQDASYTLDKAVALDGTATVPSGNTVTYQWYKGSSSDTTKGDEIPGATNATYTPTSLGSFYYYVVATNTVGTSVKTAVSEPAYVTVTMPAGAAAIPTFTKDLNPNTDSKNYDLGSPDVTDLSVTATATGAGADISYQWYSSTSASTDGGTKLDGETKNTFTPDTSVAGVTYYYCVATNTDSEATLEGYTTASVASKSVKITVAADNTMAVVSSNGANGTANTTTIELTFKYPMRGLKASDFTITPPVEDPVVESKVAITGLEEFNGGKTIKLTVSGVVAADNGRVYSLKLANLPDGITMSKDTVAVTIHANTTPAPVADAKVVTAVANGSAGTKDTDAITVTFDKDPGAVTGNDFTFTAGAAPIAADATAVSGTGTTRVVKITLGAPAGTDADKKITMTKAGKDTTSKDIEVNRDTKAPEFFGATVENTDPDTVVLTFKDDLDEGATVTKADFVVKVNGTDVATTAESVTVEGKKVKIKLAANLESTDSVLVSYTGTTITDTAVAKNKAAKFDNQVVANRVEAAASPKLAEASLSADGSTLNVAFDRPVKSSSDPSAATLDKCIKVDGLPAGVIVKSVTLATNPVTRATNNRYLNIVFSRALTAEESAKLKVTFEVPSDKKSPITDLNDTPMVDNTTPVTPDTDNVVEKAAGTATAQAGTGKKNIVVELTTGKFVDAATTTTNWELVHDGGSNTIASVTKDSPTKVTITLANAIVDADKFTIKPKAAALDTTVAAEPVTPFTVTVAPTTVSATATGTVKGVPGTEITPGVDITITLADGKFVAIDAGANTWIKNLPEGLSANITAVSVDDTTAKITVSGTPKGAASGTIEITIPQTAIKDAAADVVVESSAKYEIGAQKATFTSAEGDYEGNTIVVTLDAGKFDKSGAETTANWEIKNLPTNISVSSIAVSGSNDEIATITLSGDISSEAVVTPAITVLPKQEALDTATTTPPDAAETVTLNAVTAVGEATMTGGATSITVSLSKGSFNTSATGTTGWEIGGTDASGNTVSGVSITDATTATVTVNTAINTNSTVTLTIPQAAFVTGTTTAPSAAISITIE